MRCTAYCTASSYPLRALSEKLKQYYSTTNYRDSVHIVYQTNQSDIFFFPYGVFVCWGLTEEEERKVIGMINSIASESLSSFERDEYEFSYGEIARIQRDELILTNKDVLTLLAISFGLAQSCKLAVFESTIDKTIEKTKHLPKDLASKGKIFLSRREISRKIGELFLDKSSVNLHSNILDEPDFFWEYPEYHPLYRDVSKCFDIVPRLEVLNTRLEILSDLLQILSSQLNHQHSTTLEWTIIWLIMIEVLIAFLRDIFHLL